MRSLPVNTHWCSECEIQLGPDESAWVDLGDDVQLVYVPGHTEVAYYLSLFELIWWCCLFPALFPQEMVMQTCLADSRGFRGLNQGACCPNAQECHCI